MQLVWVVCCGILALLAAGLPTGLAQAQTVMSRAIAADTRWSLANSPYLVSADVVVQGGATVTIDAGVPAHRCGQPCQRQWVVTVVP
jgi:hypothetical protein